MDLNASDASKAGIPDEKILAVIKGAESDQFTAAERAALRLAEAMTATPPQVTDDLFQEVRHHFAEAQIVEMATIVALENFRSRFNCCFGMKGEGLYPHLSELLGAASPSGMARGQVR